MMNNKFLILTMLAALTILSCQNEKKEEPKNEITKGKPNHKKAIQPQEINGSHLNKDTKDTIILSQKHHPNSISCDLDGDRLGDIIKIVQNTKNHKYGLEIIYGNKKVEYLGMGKDILGQGFDNLDWVGIFEKAPKGEVYFNNVNEDGEIIGEEQYRKPTKSNFPMTGFLFIRTKLVAEA